MQPLPPLSLEVRPCQDAGVRAIQNFLSLALPMLSIWLWPYEPLSWAPGALYLSARTMLTWPRSVLGLE